MTPPSYLTKRGRIWYVQVPVPRSRQKAVGSKTLERSLRTQDAAEANRLRHRVIAEFQAIIAGMPEAPAADTPEALLAQALKARAEVDAGAEHPVDAEASLDHAVDRFLSVEAKRRGVTEHGHPQVPAEAAATIRRARKALAGSLKGTLAFQREAYLKETAKRLTAQTMADKRRRLEAFGEWFGDDRECSEVSRKEAGRYVAEVILHRTQGEAGDALSPSTMKKELSDLRAWFDWMLVRGVVDLNPFDRMSSTVKASTKGKEAPYREWSTKELSTVLRGMDPNDPAWSLAAIAAFTGMRREEVGELKVSSVDGDVLKVEQGKTKAAVRRVPILPALAPLVARLAESSTDGYLIPGLLRGGPDKKRSWYVGKRLGRMIRQLGVKDPRVNVHGLRRTVITALEVAGVPESTIQLITGHKRKGMTYGVYSGGVPDAMKREALEHLSYGELDGYVAKVGSAVTVRASAEARKKTSGSP